MLPPGIVNFCMALLRQGRKALSFGSVLVRAVADARRRGLGGASALERALWFHHWSPAALRALNVRVDFTGTPPRSGLLVSNHLSYVDVLVLSSVLSCAFVSKDDVEHWPLVGRLTDLAGTIYIDRNSRNDTRRINDTVVRRFASGQVVVIFPEGTSTDGSHVRPFYPSLLQSAIDARAPITPAHIAYEVEGGNAAADVCYWGDMVFVPHFWRLLGTRGIRATVRFGTARTYLERKTASLETREQVIALGGQPAR